jgi:hypothetical protein
VVSIDTGAAVLRHRDYPAGHGLWQVDLTGDGWSLIHHMMDDRLNWRARPVVVPANGGEAADV